MVKKTSNQHRAQQSNPFSTGGGGTNYEQWVQTYFVASMILGWRIPNVKSNKIEKIKLQGRYDGYDTDDCIVFGDNNAKMLCQIKHKVTFTKASNLFYEVLSGAWNDFIKSDFDKKLDSIVLIVSEMTLIDNESFNQIFSMAKTSENEFEFLKKLNSEKFVSEKTREKYNTIMYHLKTIDSSITDYNIWTFCKVFNIQVMNLDIENSFIKSAIISGLDNFIGEENFVYKLYNFVANNNQNAGTITLDEIKKDLKLTDLKQNIESIYNFKLLDEHTRLIFDSIENKVASISIDRIENDNLNNLLTNSEMVIISGERGCGKSALAKSYYKKYCQNKFVLALRAEDFNQNNLQNVFNSIGIKGTVDDLFNSCLLYSEKILFVESLEKILELENHKAFLELLSVISKRKDWKVVATLRNYAVQQVLMNFIVDYNINYEIVNLCNFDNETIEYVIKNIPEFKNIKFNEEINELIKNPFYLSSIYKIVKNGYVLSIEDNKNTIKSIIWDNVIKKSSDRKNGMPNKREKIFVTIALKRSKLMKYAVDINELGFDDALSKLEEDSLINIKDGLVYLTHDIFEDWAIENYIEKQYKLYTSNFNKFFDSIGCEQSMCRAYRLWLEEKIEDREFIINYINNILNTKDLENIWYDETIVAVIYSGKIDLFLEILEEKLFDQKCELLKRLCFMIRVTAKKPRNYEVLDGIYENEVKKSTHVNLVPFGNSWASIIMFLYNNFSKLSDDMYKHCAKILEEWSSKVNINDDLPSEAKEAGLLSLYIIDKIKDDYSVKEMVTKLFSIAMMTYRVIADEFLSFIDSTIFNKELRKHHCYIDEIADFMLSSMYAGFISKENPDILIKVAQNEWFLKKDESIETTWYYRDDINIDRKYGLNSFGINDYFPPSGKREPFRSLFLFHPKKAIDFVLLLCNRCADFFVDKSLNEYNDKDKKAILNNITCEIKINDDKTIKQYCIGNFWGAYRGMSVIPHVLESALMSLENYLLIHFENFKNNTEEIADIMKYIISNSTSVLTTSVLSSVAIPYYRSLGKSALYLLQNNEFYDMDLSRRVHEMGEHEPNWFINKSDPLTDLYILDRRQAATKDWRTKTLEDLCLNLQLTDMKDEIYKLLDQLDEKYKNNEDWQFRKNRIDFRKFSFELDEKNNQIICTSGEIKDKKLLKKSEETKLQNEYINRQMSIIMWANDAKKGKYEFDKYENPYEIIKEIETIERLIKDGKCDRLAIFSAAVIESVSIIYTRLSDELSDEQCKKCEVFLIKQFNDYDKNLSSITGNSRVDNTGLWCLSECLPIICEKLTIKEKKRIIINGLTSYDMDVRLHTAIGIGKYCKEDANFVKYCIEAIEFFDINYPSNFSNWNDGKINLRKIRNKILKNEKFCNDVNNYDELSLFSISQILLIISGKKELLNDNILIEKIINRIILAEKNNNNRTDRTRFKDDGYYELLKYFSDFFGEFIYRLDNKYLKEYKTLLNETCNHAPYFMKWTLIRVRYLSEKNCNMDKYWNLFNIIFDTMQQISLELEKGENYKFDKRKDILEEYIYLNTPWSKLDYQNPPIIDGIDYICKFVNTSNKNIIVFESMCSLIYHFPNLLIKKGILTFDSLTEQDIIYILEKNSNSVFYLENILHSFINNLDNNTLSEQEYKTCVKLLNSLIECASSKAYYTREYLIKSKKIA